ncbi:hypothetical protein Golax_016685, partial [Gossypium laxum]|nr:hypothetical protein [Gossypium laxum]
METWVLKNWLICRKRRRWNTCFEICGTPFTVHLFRKS